MCFARPHSLLTEGFSQSRSDCFGGKPEALNRPRWHKPVTGVLLEEAFGQGEEFRVEFILDVKSS